MPDALPPPQELTPEHRVLEKDVGAWDARVVIRLPGQPESVTAGEMHARLVAGGRWLVSDFSNETGFAGHGLVGWDPVRRRYVGFWADSASPCLHELEGEWDAGRRAMTMQARTTMPGGQALVMRQVTESIADDRQVFRSFMPTPSGEHEIMTIEYSRRPAGR